jgi:hypothetical protein
MSAARFLLTGLFLLTVVIALPLSAMGQETISVPFTAVEEGRQEPESTAPCSANPWVLNAEYLYSNLKMDALNDYIDWINATWSGDVDKFDRAPGLGVFLQYFFHENVGVELGYEQLEADVSGRTLAGRFKVETAFDGGLVSVVWRQAPGNGRLHVGAKLGIGYYSADYKESEGGMLYQQDHDSAVGYKAALIGNLCLTKHLSLFVTGGYRQLKFDNFDKQFVSPGYPDVELDYSGPFATLGLNLSW